MVTNEFIPCGVATTLSTIKYFYVHVSVFIYYPDMFQYIEKIIDLGFHFRSA